MLGRVRRDAVVVRACVRVRGVQVLLSATSAGEIFGAKRP